jgi:hypothetical protein
MQKPQTQVNRLSPPHTLILDYTMTHIKFGRSHVHPMVQLTNTRHSDGHSGGVPDPDGTLKEVVRIKMRHYRNVYVNHPDPIAFIPLVVNTTDPMYDEFIRPLFLGHTIDSGIGLSITIDKLRVFINKTLSILSAYQ